MNLCIKKNHLILIYKKESQFESKWQHWLECLMRWFENLQMIISTVIELRLHRELQLQKHIDLTVESCLRRNENKY